MSRSPLRAGHRAAAAVVLSLLAWPARPQTQPPAADAVFQREIRPLLQRRCVVCHSTAKHSGDVDLERFASVREVAADPRVWQKVTEQVSLGEMPPRAMPRLPAAERTRLLEWVSGTLRTVARAHAGDPGPVVLRRLNNAEYTYTMRDLTSVQSLDPAREFPADGAAGEGFLNTGNALGMSPALVTKYMDAAKAVSNHAMLLPDGIRFSAATSRRDWTEEILSDIRALYREFTEAGGEETVTQQGIALDKNRGGALPLKKYLAASLAVRGARATAGALARQHGLSPKYLGMLMRLFQEDPRPSPLLDPLRGRWRRATAADMDALAADIARWQSTLWKFSSVGHIGKVNGPKAWMEPVTPIVAQQEFRAKLSPPAARQDVTLYIAAHSAGDGTAGDIVTWREPKLVVPGRPPVLLRDVRPLVSVLTARRGRILGATARALAAASDAGGRPHDIDPEDLRAWFALLGAGPSPAIPLDLMAGRIEKTGAFDFVQGWGSAKTPMLLANSSADHVRVPGNMAPRAVALHPSQTLSAAAGWRSPVAAAVRVEASVTRAHPECGNGVTWSLEHRRGGTRQLLAQGEARNAAPAAIGPFDPVRVQPGDLISLLIGPREGNHSCDLTAVDLRISAPSENWSLAADVSGSVLAGNPHGDRAGRPGIWHFYTEPAAGAATDTVLPAGSLLSRWQNTEPGPARQRLAEELQQLLTAPAPPAGTGGADAALHRILTSLAGPLLSTVSVPRPGAANVSSEWGLDPSLFGKLPNGSSGDAASLYVQAPAVVAVRLPADLAANSEFVTTAALDHPSAAEGSVQVEVLTAKTEAQSRLLPAATTIGDAKGMWSSNNQTVSYGMPVVVNAQSAARKRMEAAFEEFRGMFPAALCYTKIVPVDEVVTLTLYHREDDHLSRLILDDKQKAKLDRLWDELHYVSRDALTLVDAFEQLWQYATQDADPSQFEPLRQPILARAAAFRKHVADTEPRHVDAVVRFAGRAWRRPLRDDESGKLRALYGQLREQGLPHEDAIRLMLARVLVAPAFLYRAETAPAGKLAAPVGDYELASRLSYFLWSSMPDAGLLAAAGSGALRQPAGIRAQTRRMLKDGRVRRLAVEFGAAWLHLHDFESLDEKSERHFPEFRTLRGPMFEETIRFFEDLFAADRSVLSLLDSDHTYLNEALARHYGIPGVAGDEWRRVEGVRQYARGGILGQAAVLSRQSGASRTSPILRGNWISEVLLGEKLPRPPKDVPQLPTDEAAESLSVRELTERHTRDPRCSGCHARVDPIGYTLERYDAIGRLRDKDLGNRPIRDRAALPLGPDRPSGYDAAGPEGLRAYLMTERRAAFVRQFCRKLLGFSLGRAVQLSDEPLIEAIEARLGQAGYRAGAAVDMIVTSRQFREIRGRDHESDHE